MSCFKTPSERPYASGVVLLGISYTLLHLLSPNVIVFDLDVMSQSARPHVQSESFHGYKGYPGYEPDTPVAESLAVVRGIIV